MSLITSGFVQDSGYKRLIAVDQSKVHHSTDTTVQAAGVIVDTSAVCNLLAVTTGTSLHTSPLR